MGFCKLPLRGESFGPKRGSLLVEDPAVVHCSLSCIWLKIRLRQTSMILQESLLLVSTSLLWTLRLAPASNLHSDTTAFHLFLNKRRTRGYHDKASKGISNLRSKHPELGIRSTEATRILPALIPLAPSPPIL